MSDKKFGVVEQRTWQVVTSNKETGEAQVHDLMYERKLPEIAQEDYENMFVRQGQPVKITPSRRAKPVRKDKLTAIIPDVHIGFRGDETFHDESAIELAHLAIRETRPDEVVVLGDLMDFPSTSKYEQRTDWASTVQKSIDRASLFLAQIRSDVPNAKIVSIIGNHDHRHEGYIRRNAQEVLGLKRANDDGLSVLSLEFLLRAAELEVEVMGGYPNGRYWVQPNILAVHGEKVGRGAVTALLGAYTVSVVQGHNHKLGLAYRTLDEQSPRQIWAMTAGTLAKTDGSLPSQTYTTDSSNRTVTRATDAHQGMAFIESNEDNSTPHLVPIVNGGLVLPGARIAHGSDGSQTPQ